MSESQFREVFSKFGNSERKALDTSLRFKSTLEISEEEVDNILGTKKQ
jgi:methyl coenzyme M reductase gamma subunit